MRKGVEWSHSILNELFNIFNIYSTGLRVAIWTTTPWTIPANLAVAVNR